MTVVRASCLCGEVRLEAEVSETSWMEHCHCSMCRKAHGASFATWIDLPRASVRFIAGEARVARYRSSKDLERLFCSRCGSSLLGQQDGADFVSIAAGVLDGDPGCRPAAHIYVASRARWVSPGAADALPQFAVNRPRP